MSRYILLNIQKEDPEKIACVNTSGMEDWEVHARIGESKSDYVEDIDPEDIESELRFIFGDNGAECRILSEENGGPVAYWHVSAEALKAYREKVLAEIYQTRITEVRKLLDSLEASLIANEAVRDTLLYRIRNGILSWCEPCIMTDGGGIDLLEKWVMIREIPEEGIFITDMFGIHY